MTRTRVLIVEDSAVVRKILNDAFLREPDFEVVGHAADPSVARDLIAETQPDVMTLDREMPRSVESDPAGRTTVTGLARARGILAIGVSTGRTRARGVPAMAVLLTGMGADGAEGMLQLKQAGHHTLAEAEESCVVFGMPREAIARGGATRVVPLLQMPSSIAGAMVRSTAARAAQEQP